ncbi:MAG: APC family permease, partial [Thermoleophilia bacterium]|nr:APC family permease [Thermoleophilia bacterium]
MAAHPSGERFTVELEKGTNWWGAFVIGLAGTILVIGLAGYALLALGGVAITLFIVLTLVGVFLCFCLAELAAAFPDRAGGLPSYAFETFKPLGTGVAEHVGGLSSWAYWLGWFTVAPINAYLAALYITDLFGIPLGGTYGPISDKFGSAWSVGVIVTAAVILLVVFIPGWLGIRLGATFATILGIGSIVPLVLIIILPFFKPSTIDFGRVQLGTLPDGVTGSWQLIVGWAFIFVWTVWAMEAAACYIGECREPARDAKIAMTAEGLFGLFVYITLPLMLLAVLGTAGFAALGSGDANVVFLGYVDAIFGANEFWRWFIGLALVAALLLSVLNALIGASRGLWQNSVDGVLPKIFSKTNKHGSPSTAIILSLVASLLVLLVGSPLQIYVFSNMGYLFALAVAMVGFGVFRWKRDDFPRPVKMPRIMGPVAILFGVLGLILWIVGGYYAADYAVGSGYRWLFWVGLILLALYVPLHLWRRIEDKR